MPKSDDLSSAPHIIELSLRKGVHLDVVGERTVPIFIVRFAERFVVDGNGSFVGDVVDDALLGGEGRVDRVDAVLIAARSSRLR